MSGTIPAWKKLGLKVSDNQGSEEIVSVAHIDSGDLTNRIVKDLNKKKRSRSNTDTQEKKPPKRPKLPKELRKAPPEKDQLSYLRQYHQDRDSWKFSKQKQNWILRNLDNISSDYENALQIYIEGLQGGSRSFVIEYLKGVVVKWNKLAEEIEAKIRNDLEESNDVKDDSNDEAPEKSTTNNASDASKSSKDHIDIDFAKRCVVLLHILGEDYPAVGIDVSEDDIDKSLQKPEMNSANSDETDEENKTNIIVEEVDVTGISSEPRHLSTLKDKGLEGTEGLNMQNSEVTDTERNSKKVKKEKKEKREKKTKKKSKSKHQENKNQ